MFFEVSFWRTIRQIDLFLFFLLFFPLFLQENLHFFGQTSSSRLTCSSGTLSLPFADCLWAKLGPKAKRGIQ